MHTFKHTPHTIRRNGTLYYNRRVPPQAQAAYGEVIRHKLESDSQARVLTERLDAIWKDKGNPVAVPINELLESCRPRQSDLLSVTEEYLSLKGIQRNPTHSTASYLTALMGNRDIGDYDRQDARGFVSWMLDSGRKTTSARRRVNCLTAVFNYAYAEFEIDLSIPEQNGSVYRWNRPQRRRSGRRLGACALT